MRMEFQCYRRVSWMSANVSGRDLDSNLVAGLRSKVSFTPFPLRERLCGAWTADSRVPDIHG